MTNTLTETVRQFLDRVSTNIDTMYEQFGYACPCYHVITGEGVQMVLPPIGLSAEQDKKLVKSVFKVYKVTRYAYIDEGYWKEEEVVTIFIEDQCEGFLLAYRAIIRPSKDEAYLGPLNIATDELSAKIRTSITTGLLPSLSETYTAH
jgi:hypothetical protein